MSVKKDVRIVIPSEEFGLAIIDPESSDDHTVMDELAVCLECKRATCLPCLTRTTSSSVVPIRLGHGMGAAVDPFAKRVVASSEECLYFPDPPNLVFSFKNPDGETAVVAEGPHPIGMSVHAGGRSVEVRRAPKGFVLQIGESGNMFYNEGFPSLSGNLFYNGGFSSLDMERLEVIKLTDNVSFPCTNVCDVLIEGSVIAVCNAREVSLFNGETAEVHSTSWKASQCEPTMLRADVFNQHQLWVKREGHVSFLDVRKLSGQECGHVTLDETCKDVWQIGPKTFAFFRDSYDSRKLVLNTGKVLTEFGCCSVSWGRSEPMVVAVRDHVPGYKEVDEDDRFALVLGTFRRYCLTGLWMYKSLLVYKQ